MALPGKPCFLCSRRPSPLSQRSPSPPLPPRPLPGSFRCGGRSHRSISSGCPSPSLSHPFSFPVRASCLPPRGTGPSSQPGLLICELGPHPPLSLRTSGATACKWGAGPRFMSQALEARWPRSCRVPGLVCSGLPSGWRVLSPAHEGGGGWRWAEISWARLHPGQGGSDRPTRTGVRSPESRGQSTRGSWGPCRLCPPTARGPRVSHMECPRP